MIGMAGRPLRRLLHRLRAGGGEPAALALPEPEGFRLRRVCRGWVEIYRGGMVVAVRGGVADEIAQQHWHVVTRQGEAAGRVYLAGVLDGMRAEAVQRFERAVRAGAEGGSDAG